MDVINSPAPNPPSIPELTALPPIDDQPAAPRWSWYAIGAALVVGLVAGTLLNPWGDSPAPAQPTLEETLDWMFNATLTHQATTAEGEVIPAPAETVEVREVQILDPVAGPILVIAELRSDGHTELVPFELETTRDGRNWTVRAQLIADQPAAVSPGES